MFRSGQRAACLFRLSVAFLQNFLCPGGITVPLYDRIGRLWSQQILNQFKHGYDMAFLLLTIFRNQQDYGCQQPFRRIIKKCILPIAAGRRTIRTDDGSRSNLSVFYRFRFCCKIVVILQVFIHVLVDQCQNVISIRAGRISQIQTLML